MINTEITCDSHSNDDNKSCGVLSCPMNPINKKSNK